MGKKSKSKNKLSKMSEEERARYLQLRADIEEEARRRKQHLISLYMKNKLKREDAFSRLNLAKINQEWRSILRQIKCQDLKHEMIEVEKFFRIALERKDRIIHQLLSELDIAEDMYATLQQSQMETIGKMIYTHNCRMEFFKQQYDKEKSLILQECEDAFSTNRNNRNKAQVQLECIVYCLQDKAQAGLKQQYEDHQNRMDDVRSTMTIQLEEITREREQKLEQLWSKYQEVLNDYIKHTESFYVEYVTLKEQDEQSSAIIRAQCHEIERATDQIAHLKIAAENAEDEANAETQYLEKARNKLAEQFAQMKKDFAERMKHEKNDFKVMGVASHMTLKALKKTLQEGESLLQLATVCRRLETEREKILPFGLPKRVLFGDGEEDYSQLPEEITQQNLLGRTSMEKFWRRVNKARMDVALMRRDKAKLEAENAKLKAQVKDFLVDINIHSGSNAHVNDFVAQRPKSMMVERTAGFELGTEKVYGQRPIRRPYTCVEANLSNAVRSRLLVSGKPTTAKIKAIVRGGF